MIKITIESPETGVKQFEADGVYALVVNENESKSIVAASYEKERFKPDFVIRSLVGLIDEAIREMVLSKDSEAVVKAVFLAMWEDMNSEKMNKKIKKIRKEINRSKEEKRCQE